MLTVAGKCREVLYVEEGIREEAGFRSRAIWREEVRPTRRRVHAQGEGSPAAPHGWACARGALAPWLGTRGIPRLPGSQKPAQNESPQQTLLRAPDSLDFRNSAADLRNLAEKPAAVGLPGTDLQGQQRSGEEWTARGLCRY